MPVDQTHPQYQSWAPSWRKCRDVARGQESVHRAGTAYLPALSGQSPPEYAAYRGRALFYNATGRTIDGLSGLVFRKPPLVQVPEAMSGFLDDVDAGGLSLQGFAERLVEDLLQVGRAGILVDYSAGSSAGLTARQARGLGRRVIWTAYGAEDILDWRCRRLGGSGLLTQVRVRERITLAHEQDEFDRQELEQVRVLELVQDGEQGGRPYYRQRLFRRGRQGWEAVEEIVPRWLGAPLGFIPFVFVGPRDTTPEVDKPPLLDLVEVNLSHYTLMADYRHGLHFTGLPTPVVTGHHHDPADGDLKIGSGTAWVFSEPEAKAFFLEFKGSGLGAMKAELEALEARMALLGSRALAPEKRAVETAEAAAIHRAGEQSLLASLATAVSLALERALGITREWGGYGREPVSIRLNTDYLAQPLDAAGLSALVKSLQAGAMSWETFVYNLARGELLPPGRTAARERELIAGAGEAGHGA